MLPYINIPFQYVAGIIGASPDELKLITSFLLSYPLAALLKRVPDAKPALKNLFIIGVSIFYLVGLFDLWDGCRTLAVSSIAVYCIAKNVQGPFMPWIGFVFCMLHLSVNQLARQFANSPSTVDITGAQMILVIKLTSFCWNVADGRLPEKDLSAYQKERAIKELPSLLDFAGYILFFPSLFAGPAFDYVDYKRWIETTMFEVPPGTDPSKKPPTRKKRKIPRSGRPASWKAATGLFWIFLFLQLSGWYSKDLLLSEEAPPYGLLHRIWILHMTIFTVRLKYYGVWALTEGACILSGLGYKGIDPATGKVSWDRLCNVNPWGVETAQNSRAYLGNWNMNTNNWLRNYIYLRVTPRGKKPGFRASMATFVTSAFWHGFYPGYYLAFVLASFVQTAAKNCRRYLRPFFLDPKTSNPTPNKIYYDIASWFITQAAFTFVTAPFILLTLPDSLLVWTRVYFYGVIGTAAVTAFFSSPGKDLLIKKHLLRTGAAEDGKLEKAASQDSEDKEPLLGLPGQPQEDLEELVGEVRAELEARQRRGSLKTGLRDSVVGKAGMPA
ncbi:putative membrane-bound O-acyltransferase-containing protein 5 [Venustampulla echinocandica]|uniref:Putative membrane-bound O-acyltransferase-containing protein 5 n=1 Tax=Venustampulla echinocandica TaxID=2656787 RepID=A0A370TII6_9HELO|nr:putative membrane-bound O-acyltransferase-containing protein 5 [Venustampulla echinocandica]RDL35171.1 putative membrane-bound O-acyltransferase-containing protein 5 [Venustampulla echinocandica]